MLRLPPALIRYPGILLHSRRHAVPSCRALSCTSIARKKEDLHTPSDDSQKPKFDNGVTGPGALPPDKQDVQRKLTQKEKDELIMQKMKERMSLEGDELWEDGAPVEGGLRRNVKENMFRLI